MEYYRDRTIHASILAMRFMLLAMVIVAAACTGDDTTYAPADESFVETVVELRRAALEAGPDTALYAELRAQVLEERGMTEDELRAYVSARSADLDHMAMIWD